MQHVAKLKVTPFFFVTFLALLLAGCGGGGGCGATVALGNAASSLCSKPDEINPLKKYEGTFYYCETNKRATIQLTPTGSQSINLSVTAEIFNQPNCSGNIVGTYSFDKPILVTFTGKLTASLPEYTIFPTTDMVDLVSINRPAMTPTLSAGNGGSVNGNCINYTYSNGTTSSSNTSCITTLETFISNGAMYSTNNNQYLATFILSNGSLNLDEIYSKTSSFDINSLEPKY